MITARARYEQLSTDREPYIDRAEECAKYTIPSLFPENQDTIGDKGKLITPFQSAGSAGVNNLASKLLLTLFPPDAPFYRFLPSAKVRKEIDSIQNPDEQAEVQRGLDESFSKMEEQVLSAVNTSSDRTTLAETCKHLVVTGNGLFHDGDQGARFFPLNQYVVARDSSDNVLEIVVKETVSPMTLTEDVRKYLSKQYTEDDVAAQVDIYTRITRGATNWDVYQEVEEHVIDTSTGTYPLDACPWIALRLIKVSGSAYGRSYVEEYLGDLKSLDALSEAIVTGAAIASKVVFLVNPNGTTDEKDLEDAASGDFVTGSAEDVTSLYVEKSRDFQTAAQTSQELKETLAHAFLQNSAIQRNGERVTAEEIRYVAGELEDVMGGIYAMLSQEFQLPYVKAKLNKLMRNGTITSVDPKLIQPVIITGLDALGRRHDSQRIVEFLQIISQNFGPEAIGTYCDVRQIIHELSVSMGVSQKNIVKTDKQIEAEQAQAQQQQTMQQMVDKGTGPAVNQLGAMINNAVQPQQQAPQEGSEING